MIRKYGNYTVFDIPVKDENGTLLTDLSTATAIKYMIKEDKEDLDSAALISKYIGSGVSRDVPAIGYVRIIIQSSDFTAVSPDVKYFHALQIEYSSDYKYEVDLVENDQITEDITFVQDTIR